MKHYITPEEHARMQRRRGRQALGLLVAILVIVGFVTVLRAGVGAVAMIPPKSRNMKISWKGLCCLTPCHLMALRTSTT